MDTLERRWNAVLERVTEVEQRLAAGAAEGPPRPTVDREQLLALARDFPAVWRHPRTAIQLKKPLVRLLVEEIVVTVTAELCRRAPGGARGGSVRVWVLCRDDRAHGRGECRRRAVMLAIPAVSRASSSYGPDLPSRCDQVS